MKNTVIMRQNRDFQGCYSRGEYFASRCLVLYVRKNKLDVTRLGITTGKKIGNAVVRSRARRIIRAAWQAVESDVPKGLDIVIVARQPIARAASTDLLQYLQTKGVPALKAYARGKRRVRQEKTG